MRYEPSFVKETIQRLKSVDKKIKDKISHESCLTERQFVTLLGQPQFEISIDECEQATEKDVIRYKNLFRTKVGFDAVKRGEVAFIVLAGDDEAKNLWRFPCLGPSLVMHKVHQARIPTRKGLIEAPIWIMTSPDHIESFLSHSRDYDCTPRSLFTFKQFQCYRLGVDNNIEMINDTTPKLSSSGTGDLGPVMLEHDLFLLYPKVKYCVIVNGTNVLASLDEKILTHHIETQNKVTFEVVKKEKEDIGSSLLYMNGKLQIVNDNLLNYDFQKESLYHNTNSMVVDVEVLKTEIPWSWEKVRRHENFCFSQRFERFIHQYSEFFDSNYVLVERDERYFPVRTQKDLSKADQKLNSSKGSM